MPVGDQIRVEAHSVTTLGTGTMPLADHGVRAHAFGNLTMPLSDQAGQGRR
jgi:hypothetical protein